MTLNRSAQLLVVGSLLVGPLGLAAAANAEPASPLYRLVDTAAQRLETADPVAASKWISGGSITDDARATQVLDAVGADATTHGIDPQYVRTVFTDQVSATEGLEYSLFGQWKFNPAIAPATAPDLANSRTEIDGYNRTMVDEIASQWNSLHSSACKAELSKATDQVSAERRLNPMYKQALSSATRSYCPAT